MLPILAMSALDPFGNAIANAGALPLEVAVAVAFRVVFAFVEVEVFVGLPPVVVEVPPFAFLPDIRLMLSSSFLHR